jgi:hypothetical protein
MVRLAGGVKVEVEWNGSVGRRSGVSVDCGVTRGDDDGSCLVEWKV